MKKILHQLVIFSIKNHWLVLLLLTGFMYLSGKIMTNDLDINLNLTLQTSSLIRSLHKTIGKLIFIIAIFLTLEKGYLWLKRKNLLK